MASAQSLPIVLAALLFASATGPAQALQLGESRAQTIARHGGPGAEDRGVAIYFWDGWSAELEYEKDAVRKLIYRRHTNLREAEIAALLQSNGGFARWRERTTSGDSTRTWVRDDGAVAKCPTLRPMMMTFQGGEPLSAASGPKPTVVVKAPASSVPPAFPKLLGSGPTPEPAAISTLNPLPKLQAEELGVEVNPPTAGSETAVEPPPAPADPEESTTSPASTALAASEPDARGGSVFGWLAAFVAAIAGGGLFLMKRKTGPVVAEKVESARPLARRSEAKAAVTVTPALDTLRRDQCDLLVGEIFRREGYTVELSAAAAQDDGIDLTLRRDGETILVQCKHWNTARVSEREVREFHGAMMENGAPRGVFVTTGSVTRDAVEFAEARQIDLMDRAALEECTAAVARPGENFCTISEWIGEFSAHSRIFDPECPICQGSMVIRHNRTTGAASWNCRNHPRCPGRREPRLDLLAVAAAH